MARKSIPEEKWGNMVTGVKQITPLDLKTFYYTFYHNEEYRDEKYSNDGLKLRGLLHPSTDLYLYRASKIVYTSPQPVTK
jgi:hypothetical protein